MPDLVVVVGPHGEETHTPLNARDLVLHVPGYSYGNGKKASPVESSPYAVVAPPPGTPEPAKAVLDRYGSGSDPMAAQPAAAPVVFKAPQVAEAAAAPVVVAAPVAEPESAPVVEPVTEAAVEEVVAPAKERQKRAPKAEA